MLKIESYIAPWLFSYLDKYIKNLKPEDLRLSIWGGEVKLSNLDLKLDVLQKEINLPFELTNGHIHELTVSIPYKSWSSEPIVIRVNLLEFTIKTFEPVLEDPEGDIKNSNDPPGITLTPKQVVNLSDTTTTSPTVQTSWWSNFINNNVKYQFTNVVLKYLESSNQDTVDAPEDLIFTLHIKYAEYGPGRLFDLSRAVSSQAPQGTERRSGLYGFSFPFPLPLPFALDGGKVLLVHDLTLCLDRGGWNGRYPNSEGRDPKPPPLIYQEPVVRRCDLTFLLGTEALPRNSSSLLLDVYCGIDELEISLSDSQLPLAHRALELFVALVRGNLPARPAPPARTRDDGVSGDPFVIRDNRADPADPMPPPENSAPSNGDVLPGGTENPDSTPTLTMLGWAYSIFIEDTPPDPIKGEDDFNVGQSFDHHSEQASHSSDDQPLTKNEVTNSTNVSFQLCLTIRKFTVNLKTLRIKRSRSAAVPPGYRIELFPCVEATSNRVVFEMAYRATDLVSLSLTVPQLEVGARPGTCPCFGFRNGNKRYQSPSSDCQDLIIFRSTTAVVQIGDESAFPMPYLDNLFQREDRSDGVDPIGLLHTEACLKFGLRSPGTGSNLGTEHPITLDSGSFIQASYTFLSAPTTELLQPLEYGDDDPQPNDSGHTFERSALSVVVGPFDINATGYLYRHLITYSDILAAHKFAPYISSPPQPVCDRIIPFHRTFDIRFPDSTIFLHPAFPALPLASSNNQFQRVLQVAIRNTAISMTRRSLIGDHVITRSGVEVGGIDLTFWSPYDSSSCRLFPRWQPPFCDTSPTFTISHERGLEVTGGAEYTQIVLDHFNVGISSHALTTVLDIAMSWTPYNLKYHLSHGHSLDHLSPSNPFQSYVANSQSAYIPNRLCQSNMVFHFKIRALKIKKLTGYDASDEIVCECDAINIEAENESGRFYIFSISGKGDSCCIERGLNIHYVGIRGLEMEIELGYLCINWYNHFVSESLDHLIHHIELTRQTFRERADETSDVDQISVFCESISISEFSRRSSLPKQIMYSSCVKLDKHLLPYSKDDNMPCDISNLLCNENYGEAGHENLYINTYILHYLKFIKLKIKVEEVNLGLNLTLLQPFSDKTNKLVLRVRDLSCGHAESRHIDHVTISLAAKISLLLNSDHLVYPFSTVCSLTFASHQDPGILCELSFRSEDGIKCEVGAALVHVLCASVATSRSTISSWKKYGVLKRYLTTPAHQHKFLDGSEIEDSSINCVDWAQDLDNTGHLVRCAQNTPNIKFKADIPVLVFNLGLSESSTNTVIEICHITLESLNSSLVPSYTQISIIDIRLDNLGQPGYNPSGLYNILEPDHNQGILSTKFYHSNLFTGRDQCHDPFYVDLSLRANGPRKLTLNFGSVVSRLTDLGEIVEMYATAKNYCNSTEDEFRSFYGDDKSLNRDLKSSDVGMPVLYKYLLPHLGTLDVCVNKFELELVLDDSTKMPDTGRTNLRYRSGLLISCYNFGVKTNQTLQQGSSSKGGKEYTMCIRRFYLTGIGEGSIVSKSSPVSSDSSHTISWSRNPTPSRFPILSFGSDGPENEQGFELVLHQQQFQTQDKCQEQGKRFNDLPAQIDLSLNCRGGGTLYVVLGASELGLLKSLLSAIVLIYTRSQLLSCSVRSIMQVHLVEPKKGGTNFEGYSEPEPDSCHSLPYSLDLSYQLALPTTRIQLVGGDELSHYKSAPTSPHKPVFEVTTKGVVVTIEQTYSGTSALPCSHVNLVHHFSVLSLRSVSHSTVVGHLKITHNGYTHDGPEEVRGGPPNSAIVLDTAPIASSPGISDGGGNTSRNSSFSLKQQIRKNYGDDDSRLIILAVSVPVRLNLSDDVLFGALNYLEKLGLFNQKKPEARALRRDLAPAQPLFPLIVRSLAYTEFRAFVPRITLGCVIKSSLTRDKAPHDGDRIIYYRTKATLSKVAIKNTPSAHPSMFQATNQFTFHVPYSYVSMGVQLSHPTPEYPFQWKRALTIVNMDLKLRSSHRKVPLSRPSGIDGHTSGLQRREGPMTGRDFRYRPSKVFLRKVAEPLGGEGGVCDHGIPTPFHTTSHMIVGRLEANFGQEQYLTLEKLWETVGRLTDKYTEMVSKATVVPFVQSYSLPASLPQPTTYLTYEFKDDLRSLDGGFTYKFTNVAKTLPDDLEILFYTQDNGNEIESSMCWKYPEARSVDKVTFNPLPFADNDRRGTPTPECHEIQCRLEYVDEGTEFTHYQEVYDGVENESDIVKRWFPFKTLVEFSITEGIIYDLPLIDASIVRQSEGGASVRARIWKITLYHSTNRLADCIPHTKEHSKIDLSNDDTAALSSHPQPELSPHPTTAFCSPLALAGSVVVDSSLSLKPCEPNHSLVVGNLGFSLECGGIKISLVNHALTLLSIMKEQDMINVSHVGGDILRGILELSPLDEAPALELNLEASLRTVSIIAIDHGERSMMVNLSASNLCSHIFGVGDMYKVPLMGYKSTIRISADRQSRPILTSWKLAGLMGCSSQAYPEPLKFFVSPHAYHSLRQTHQLWRDCLDLGLTTSTNRLTVIDVLSRLPLTLIIGNRCDISIWIRLRPASPYHNASHGRDDGGIEIKPYSNVSYDWDMPQNCPLQNGQIIMLSLDGKRWTERLIAGTSPALPSRGSDIYCVGDHFTVVNRPLTNVLNQVLIFGNLTCVNYTTYPIQVSPQLPNPCKPKNQVLECYQSTLTSTVFAETGDICGWVERLEYMINGLRLTGDDILDLEKISGDYDSKGYSLKRLLRFPPFPEDHNSSKPGQLLSYRYIVAQHFVYSPTNGNVTPRFNVVTIFTPPVLFDFDFRAMLRPTLHGQGYEQELGTAHVIKYSVRIVRGEAKVPGVPENSKDSRHVTHPQEWNVLVGKDGAISGDACKVYSSLIGVYDLGCWPTSPIELDCGNRLLIDLQVGDDRRNTTEILFSQAIFPTRSTDSSSQNSDPTGHKMFDAIVDSIPYISSSPTRGLNLPPLDFYMPDWRESHSFLGPHGLTHKSDLSTYPVCEKAVSAPRINSPTDHSSQKLFCTLRSFGGCLEILTRCIHVPIIKLYPDIVMLNDTDRDLVLASTFPKADLVCFGRHTSLLMAYPEAVSSGATSHERVENMFYKIGLSESGSFSDGILYSGSLMIDLHHHRTGSYSGVSYPHRSANVKGLLKPNGYTTLEILTGPYQSYHISVLSTLDYDRLTGRVSGPQLVSFRPAFTFSVPRSGPTTDLWCSIYRSHGGDDLDLSDTDQALAVHLKTGDSTHCQRLGHVITSKNCRDDLASTMYLMVKSHVGSALPSIGRDNRDLAAIQVGDFENFINSTGSSRGSNKKRKIRFSICTSTECRSLIRDHASNFYLTFNCPSKAIRPDDGSSFKGSVPSLLGTEPTVNNIIIEPDPYPSLIVENGTELTLVVFMDLASTVTPHTEGVTSIHNSHINVFVDTFDRPQIYLVPPYCRMGCEPPWITLSYNDPGKAACSSPNTINLLWFGFCSRARHGNEAEPDNVDDKSMTINWTLAPFSLDTRASEDENVLGANSNIKRTTLPLVMKNDLTYAYISERQGSNHLNPYPTRSLRVDLISGQDLAVVGDATRYSTDPTFGDVERSQSLESSLIIPSIEVSLTRLLTLSPPDQTNSDYFPSPLNEGVEGKRFVHVKMDDILNRKRSYTKDDRSGPGLVLLQELLCTFIRNLDLKFGFESVPTALYGDPYERKYNSVHSAHLSFNQMVIDNCLYGRRVMTSLLTCHSPTTPDDAPPLYEFPSMLRFGGPDEPPTRLIIDVAWHVNQDSSKLTSGPASAIAIHRLEISATSGPGEVVPCIGIALEDTFWLPFLSGYLLPNYTTYLDSCGAGLFDACSKGFRHQGTVGVAVPSTYYGVRTILINRLTVTPIKIKLAVQFSLGKIFISSSHTPLRLTSLSLSNVYSDSDTLLLALIATYAGELIKDAGWIIGSLDMIGSPAFLITSIAEGLNRAFTFKETDKSSDGEPLPVKSTISLHTLTSLVRHLTFNSANMTKTLTASLLTCIGNACMSLSRNMEHISMDRDHQYLQKLSRIRNASVSSNYSNVAGQEGFNPTSCTVAAKADINQGLSSLGLSILGAVAGIIDIPIKDIQRYLDGLRDTGSSSSEVAPSLLRLVPAFAKITSLGVAKGLLGVIVKPIGGVSELIASSAKGILTYAGLNLSATQMRPPHDILVDCRYGHDLRICKGWICDPGPWLGERFIYQPRRITFLNSSPTRDIVQPRYILLLQYPSHRDVSDTETGIGGHLVIFRMPEPGPEPIMVLPLNELRCRLGGENAAHLNDQPDLMMLTLSAFDENMYRCSQDNIQASVDAVGPRPLNLDFKIDKLLQDHYLGNIIKEAEMIYNEARVQGKPFMHSDISELPYTDICRLECTSLGSGIMASTFANTLENGIDESIL